MGWGDGRVESKATVGGANQINRVRQTIINNLVRTKKGKNNVAYIHLVSSLYGS